MNYSSNSYTTTFTLTNAKYLASKIATDLKRLQRFYGKPTDKQIKDYENEVILLLNNGYFDAITYGFKKNSKWIEPTLRYTAKQLSSGIDDDPGRISANTKLDDTTFYSYLTYSEKWQQLSPGEKEEFRKKLPIVRSDAPESQVDGYWQSDKIYSSGGVMLNRTSLKGF